MFKQIRRLGVPFALAGAVVVAACGRDADDSLAQDTALASDLALAGGDTVQPQLQDVPPAGAPAATQPRTTTPRTTTPTTPRTTPAGNVETRGTRGTEPSVTTVPAGTALNLSAGSRICTNTNKAGERFTATTTEAVTAGGVTIPAGATAVIQISNLRRSDNATEPVVMTFNVVSLSWGGKTYPVTAEVTSAQVDRVRTTTRESDAKKVIGGAVVGAAIGQILGKDTKSTVIGAATGAAAGTAVAMGTGDYDGCIPQGGRIAIRLTQPTQVTAE